MKWRYIHNDRIESPFTQEEKDHAVAHGVAGTFEEIKDVATPPEAKEKEIKEVKSSKDVLKDKAE